MFTSQLERALEEIYAAIQERQEKTKYSDLIQQSQQWNQQVEQERADYDKLRKQAQQVEQLLPFAGDENVEAAEHNFTIMNKHQHQFQYNRALDFDPILNSFENAEHYDLFIFIFMLPNILKTELKESAAVLTKLLTEDDIEYIHSLDTREYEGKDSRILEILDKMLPKRKEISNLLDRFTDVIRSKCGDDCSRLSIPFIINTSTESGGTKSKRIKSKRKTRKRVK